MMFHYYVICSMLCIQISFANLKSEFVILRNLEKENFEKIKDGNNLEVNEFNILDVNIPQPHLILYSQFSKPPDIFLQKRVLANYYPIPQEDQTDKSTFESQWAKVLLNLYEIPSSEFTIQTQVIPSKLKEHSKSLYSSTSNKNKNLNIMLTLRKSNYILSKGNLPYEENLKDFTKPLQIIPDDSENMMYKNEYDKNNLVDLKKLYFSEKVNKNVEKEFYNTNILSKKLNDFISSKIFICKLFRIDFNCLNTMQKQKFNHEERNHKKEKKEGKDVIVYDEVPIQTNPNENYDRQSSVKEVHTIANSQSSNVIPLEINNDKDIENTPVTDTKRTDNYDIKTFKMVYDTDPVILNYQDELPNNLDSTIDKYLVTSDIKNSDLNSQQYIKDEDKTDSYDKGMQLLLRTELKKNKLKGKHLITNLRKGRIKNFKSGYVSDNSHNLLMNFKDQENGKSEDNSNDKINKYFTNGDQESKVLPITYLGNILQNVNSEKLNKKLITKKVYRDVENFEDEGTENPVKPVTVSITTTSAPTTDNYEEITTEDYFQIDESCPTDIFLIILNALKCLLNSITSKLFGLEIAPGCC